MNSTLLDCNTSTTHYIKVLFFGTIMYYICIMTKVDLHSTTREYVSVLMNHI